jgi:site-specific DNA-cytosine methylase
MKSEIERLHELFCEYAATDTDQSPQLVLSFFHGVDLLGRGFEEEGFCVVRELHVPRGKFDGMIAGSPCNDWSLANRTHRTYNGTGRQLLREFAPLLTCPNKKRSFQNNGTSNRHRKSKGKNGRSSHRR